MLAERFAFFFEEDSLLSVISQARLESPFPKEGCYAAWSEVAAVC